MAGLTNLVWREHVWPKDPWDLTDEEAEVLPCFDACEDETGRIFVWYAQTGTVVGEGYQTREVAVAAAGEFARTALSSPRTE